METITLNEIKDQLNRIEINLSLLLTKNKLVPIIIPNLLEEGKSYTLDDIHVIYNKELATSFTRLKLIKVLRNLGYVGDSYTKKINGYTKRVIPAK